jgi:hypothetical protein
MNRLILVLFFLLLFFKANAQDRIISINHDTINCSIVSVSNELILYIQINKDGSVSGNFIPLSKVATYSRSHKPGKNLKFHKPEISKPGDSYLNLICLKLNAGISTMPNFIDNLLYLSPGPDFYNKLKSGFHLNVDAHYMFKNYFGLGLDYSFFKTSANGGIPLEYSPSVFRMGTEKCRNYIKYFGGSVLFQQHLGTQRRFMLSETISAGMLFLRLEDQSTCPDVNVFGYNDIIKNSLLKGNSVAAKFGLTAEYRLFNTIWFGLGGNYMIGSVKKASIEAKSSDNSSSSIEKQKLSEAIGISRIDYSFVLRYYF